MPDFIKLKDTLLGFINHMNWREEQEIVDARADISDALTDEEPAQSSAVEPGVKNSDGSPFTLGE